MLVVDHCNLNCAGCDHFSPMAKERFCSVEVFEDSMRILKEKIPQLK